MGKSIEGTMGRFSEKRNALPLLQRTSQVDLAFQPSSSLKVRNIQRALAGPRGQLSMLGRLGRKFARAETLASHYAGVSFQP
jgi:hypothetical protein